jgi:multidrug resistance efflux pump
MKDLDDLRAQVEAETNVDTAAITLIQGLTTRIQQLAQQPTVSSADLQALSAQLNQNQQSLAAAIVANTLAAPTPDVTPSNPAPASNGGGTEPTT